MPDRIISSCQFQSFESKPEPFFHIATIHMRLCFNDGIGTKLTHRPEWSEFVGLLVNIKCLLRSPKYCISLCSFLKYFNKVELGRACIQCRLGLKGNILSMINRLQKSRLNTIFKVDSCKNFSTCSANMGLACF